MVKVKLTSPKDMGLDKSNLETTLSKFEEKLFIELKNKPKYIIEVEGIIDREICDKVEEAYKEVGWDIVECVTSFEINSDGDAPRIHLKMGDVDFIRLTLIKTTRKKMVFNISD